MMRSLLLFYLAFFMLAANSANAQDGWKWPAGKESEAKGIYEKMGTALKGGDANSARAQLVWLLNEAPDLSPELYEQGAKVYRELALKEEGSMLKKTYADSCVFLYDVRKQKFGASDEMLADHASDAYAVLKKYRSLSSLNYLHTILKEAVEKGADLKPDVLLGYMKTTNYFKSKGAPVSDIEVVRCFKAVNEGLERKITGAANKKVLAKYKHLNKSYFNKALPLTCEYVQSKYQAKADALTPEEGEEVLTLLSVVECSDKSLFLKASEAMLKGKPSLGLLNKIAAQMMDSKNYDKALENYKKGFEFAKTDAEKADLHLAMASAYAKKKQKAQARKEALEAAKLGSAKKAYTFVGDLYMGSFLQLKQGKNRVHDHAIYIAAYNMYKKAGNSAGMKKAKANWPKKEHLFSYSIKEGTPYKIGGWVGTTVKLVGRQY
ncbi:hypothetical protein FUAX_43790 (plasmid) [Fulvitalea axinellae]|uniref:Tetratricopeptide repeat protein n=1 Tax=Fulvitalea axinellae TaxID=1182444 RepID=A0AAU9D2W0_9BACT|nr:hypothetical protein FUAX_43790 [Fulvitalea axinellae]